MILSAIIMDLPLQPKIRTTTESPPVTVLIGLKVAGGTGTVLTLI